MIATLTAAHDAIITALTNIGRDNGMVILTLVCLSAMLGTIIISSSGPELR